MHGMGLHVHAACMVWGYMYMQHAWYGATCTCSMHGMGLHVHAACMVWGYMYMQHARYGATCAYSMHTWHTPTAGRMLATDTGLYGDTQLVDYIDYCVQRERV